MSNINSRKDKSSSSKIKFSGVSNNSLKKSNKGPMNILLNFADSDSSIFQKQQQAKQNNSGSDPTNQQ